MARKEGVRERSKRGAAFACVLLVALVSGAAAAQGREEAAASPREAVRTFLDAGRHGRLEEATRLLSTEDRVRPELVPAARELLAVLDAYAPADLATLSDAPEGRGDDQLSPVAEEVARVPASDGHGAESVRLARDASGRWFFAPATVARVPVWYRDLPDRALRDRLPEWLLRPGPKGLAGWQMVALLLLALASAAVGRLLYPPLRWALGKAAARTTNRFDDLLLAQLQGPTVLLMAAVIAAAALQWLMLKPSAATFVDGLLTAARLGAVFWGLLRAVELGGTAANESPLLADKPEMKALLPLVTRTGKVAVWAVAGVVVLQELGYPAASLVAGLGIGGLAFALAAQKTVEHFFGSVTLSLDQPFRPGDNVKIDDITGVVELVGIRSTRIRTGERTVVTIPNGRLAEQRIESFAPRDRLRLAFTLPLSLDTRAGVVEAILRELDALLAALPRRHAELPVVALAGLGASGLVVEATAWLECMSASDFAHARERLLLAALAVVEKHGARLHGAGVDAGRVA
jgi:MscS family membrane protein